MREKINRKMDRFINKEISWLSFNARVLQEAADSSVPLMERIRFSGIYSNNLDEFYRVRVATLNRLAKIGKQAKKYIGHDPRDILRRIQKIVLRQQTDFDAVYQQIIRDLAREKIHIIDETGLDEEQAEFVAGYFRVRVRPKLMPIMLRQVEKFPYLKDKSIYLAVCMTITDPAEEHEFALIEIPTDVLPRFVSLPDVGRKKSIMLLDDVIRFGLAEIFHAFHFDRIGAFTIKLTRDAELDIDDDLSESYIKKISKSLKQRQLGTPVRFIYDADMPDNLLQYFQRRLNIGKGDTLIPGARHHNFKDFINFPDIGLKKLKYKPTRFLVHPRIEQARSIFEAMKNQDLLLHYPYHTFHYVLDLLRDASIDPDVVSIKITLYRVAKNSSVVNALLNAVRNGKEVVANIELQARFDEEANIDWSNRLQEEGARVRFGVPGLKVHSKLCLIKRREGKKIVRYGIIGTGNFDEDTARVYADHHLFTTDKRLTRDMEKVFDFFENNYKIPTFKHLIVSPFATRRKLIKFIRGEVQIAKKGEPARIFIKTNNLVDPAVIDALYEASNAGVEIQLIVRSFFSPVTGIAGMSDRIRAVSIVDKYLEHSRIWMFHNGGDERCFITSADIMQRNLDRRVEVTCPIYDPKIREELSAYLDLQWKDNVKARILDPDLRNRRRRNTLKRDHRSQWTIPRYLEKRHQA